MLRRTIRPAEGPAGKKGRIPFAFAGNSPVPYLARQVTHAFAPLLDKIVTRRTDSGAGVSWGGRTRRVDDRRFGILSGFDRMGAIVAWMILSGCFTVCSGWMTPVAAQGPNASERPNTPEPSVPKEGHGRRPNIVWIMSEDNSKHYLRHFDPSGAPAPNIEALAAQGVTFDRAFSNSPVCSVARTTLITASYAPRVGTQFHRRNRLASLEDHFQMFPAYLREAGYYTTNHAKEDYNAAKSPDPWDESSRRASWKNRPDASTPFFHVQTYTESHESRLHFDVAALRETPDTDPAAVELQPYFPDTPTFRFTRAKYHDRMAVIDRLVGEFVDDLRESDVLDDTFIFYFGDHGGVLPASKGYTSEAGLHVPLIVTIPRNFADLVDRAPGSRCPGFVEFVDFGPTVLRLAGVPIPDGVDGRPFLGPNVLAGEVDSRDETVGYADRFDEKYDLVRTLRQGDWKYVRNYEAFLPDGLQNNYRYRMLAYAEWRELFRRGELDAIRSRFFLPKPVESLYDLRADPHETEDLATDPRHGERLGQMRGRLRQRLTAWPDLSFFPEPVLVGEAMDDPIAFGRSHASRIGRLMDTADLALLSWDEAWPKLSAALADPDPWVRHWAVIAASCFGAEAAPLAAEVLGLADDPEPLVASRVAEFLAVAIARGAAAPGDRDPRELLYGTISRAEVEIEALPMLNTAVLFNDFTDGRFPIEVARIRFGFEPQPRGEVMRRIDYLRGNLP